MAASLFDGIPGSLFQRWRPAICPFDALIEQVPRDSTVLDVGCGSGLFLGLLAGTGRLRSAMGFDSSAAAIGKAQQMQRRLPEPGRLSFECRSAAAEWPAGSFDVVSIIDVMHHVPPQHQASVIRIAASRIKPGGVLLYKDMVRRPFWRAAMNRLHDLVLARQWIHYAPIEDVRRWVREAGLVITLEQQHDMLWYGHEMLVARRPPAG
jgi:2-polyprenyl-3-methyl-5-hydroxy-6-metoxy-1,4-benzoquinol methylase